MLLNSLFGVGFAGKAMSQTETAALGGEYFFTPS